MSEISRTCFRSSNLPFSSRKCSSSSERSKWSSIEGLPRPGTMRISVRPARTASSTTFWIAGLSTIGSISFGCAFVPGRNRVPSPAAGMTAFLTFIRRPLWTGTGAYRQAGPSENLACSRLPALEERLDDAGIELLAGLTLYLLNGLLGRQRRAMRPVVRERLPGVGDGDDARCERDLLALHPEVALAVPALVVGSRDVLRPPKQ